MTAINKRSIIIIAAMLIMVIAAGSRFTLAAEDANKNIETYELHIPLVKNGGTVVSAIVSDTSFSLTCRYPEDLSEDNGISDKCANITGFRLKDGTLISCDSNDFELNYDADDQQTFIIQSISPDRLKEQISPEEIEAVYITERDSEEIEIILKETDIRTQFLKWRFTSNTDDRWITYQSEIDSIYASDTEEAALSDTQDSGEVMTGIVMPSSEIQEQLEAAADRYYSPISEFTSDDLINGIISNRTPMSEDEYFLECGVESELIDVIFGEGKEDPFVSGLIYDFDALILLTGYENCPDFQYVPDENGYIHRTGQITVDDGIITRIYVGH